MEIPAQLDGADVVLFTSKGNYGFVRCLNPNEGDEDIRFLTICRYKTDTRFYLFGLNDNMEVICDTLWDSVAEAQEAAKSYSDKRISWKRKPMDKPKIRVDFNELAGNIVLLSQSDTKTDSDGNLVTLHEGMWVTVYDEDEEDGQPDNLIAEGIVVPNPLVKEHPAWAHVKWCCRIDQNGIKHESDLSG